MDSKVIRQYLRIILRWWWLLVIGALIPAVASYYFASQQPALYQAKAKIMVGTSLQDPDLDAYQLSLSRTLATAYAELLEQGPIIETVIKRLGLQKTVSQLATQIGTNIYSGAQILEIQVTDTNPEAAALIANALADELIRHSPAAGGSDPAQQEFIRQQLEGLQVKIGEVSGQIDDLTASLADLTSAAEIQDTQERIAAFEEVRVTYQTAYADLTASYRAESPNVLSLFEAAEVPQWPLPSKTKLFVAIAAAAGVGLALGAIFLIEFMDTSLRWERGGGQSILELPVLGAVPQISGKNVLSAHNPLSPVAEGMRAIRANIFLMRPARPFKTLLLTSPSPSEGKSFVLANLAVVLASAGNRVIVVDADMRKPTLHELFDQPNVIGLANVLSNQKDGVEQPLSIPLQETGFDGVSLLSAGRPPADPAVLLTSPRLVELLESLSSQGDVILVDSPPVLSSPDAIILATMTEGTILVASTGLTKRESVQQARDRLAGQQGVNLLGLTINRVKAEGSYYSYSPGQEVEELKREVKSDKEAVLTLSEAAVRLGISKDQARRWCKSGRLPAVRKGLWWRVDPVEIERMLEDTWEIKSRADHPD